MLLNNRANCLKRNISNVRDDSGWRKHRPSATRGQPNASNCIMT